jgi:hypothetical protein
MGTDDVHEPSRRGLKGRLPNTNQKCTIDEWLPDVRVDACRVVLDVPAGVALLICLVAEVATRGPLFSLVSREKQEPIATVREYLAM